MIPAELRHEIRLRERWLCIRCCKAGAHVHHRKLRSQGGQNEAANLILLCGACHALVHSQRAGVGIPGGFIVPSWADPATTPVLTPSGLVLLTADFRRVPVASIV